MLKTDLRISKYNHELTKSYFTIQNQNEHQTNTFNNEYVEYYFKMIKTSVGNSMTYGIDFHLIVKYKNPSFHAIVSVADRRSHPSLMDMPSYSHDKESLTETFTLVNYNHIVPIYVVISLFEKVESPQELWIKNILEYSKDDIEIHCDDGMINMSRSLLSQQSPVMSAMFNNNYVHGDIELKDVQIDVLLLTDEILNHSKKRHREFDMDLYVRTANFADQYLFTSVLQYCIMSIMSNISKDNAKMVIELSKVEKLTTLCNNFL